MTLIFSIPRGDPTSERTLWFTSVAFRVYLLPVISTCGLVSNVINILVFSRMSLKDGTTATFLVLSVSDSLLATFGVALSVASAVRFLGPAYLRRTAYALFSVFILCGTYPNNFTSFCTVVIAVVRCCSVAMPLRVKSVLTVRRQLLAILFLVMSSVASGAYIMSCYKFVFVPDPALNFTHLVMTLAPGWQRHVQVMDVYRWITFYSSFFTVNICIVILVVFLRRSSKFRTGASSVTDKSGRSKEDRASRRETQVVKTVVLVSVVYTVCNLPGITLAILRDVIPGFRTVGYLYRSFDMLLIFTETAGQISAFVNIVVYLSTNSHYRKIFNSLFGFQKNNI